MIRALFLVLFVLLTTGCDKLPKADSDANDAEFEATPSSFKRPLRPSPTSKQLQPTLNGVCRFEEHDPSERPSDLIRTNHASNMIFWADKGAYLWDHPNGLIDEGMVVPGFRIVAARDGLPDLWIYPNRDGPIYLFSGPDIFECRQPESF